MTKKSVNRYPFFMIISFDEAIQKILNGEVVSLPTDTLYGLSARIDSEESIKKVFDLKRRPYSSPLITLVADINTLLNLISEVPPNTIDLAYSFWPGPLTIVLPVNPQKIPSIVRAGQKTCAFRIPANKELISLIQQTGPIVSTSANLTGTPSTTDLEEVERAFGIDFPIVKRAPGTTLIGIESTLITYEIDHWKILRNGVIDPQHFVPVLGYVPELASEKKMKLFH